MKFSFAAFFTIAGLVALSAIASLADGTFTNRRVTMGFLYHGGMWGDLILMSVVTGFVFPYFLTNPRFVIPALLISCAVTFLAHVQWAQWMRKDGITGHVFPGHQTGVWYLDLSPAGWIHVVVMAVLLTAFVLYAISATPATVVFIVSILLSVHVLVGSVQPAWYCTGKLWSWPTVSVVLLSLGIIWTTAALKYRVARPGL